MQKTPKKFRACWFGTLFLLAACGNRLSDNRATELVRLNYRQQSLTEGAGSWLLDTVEIHSVVKIPDTITQYKVTAYTRGIYSLPVIEDAPRGAREIFYDTVQFIARKTDKVWSTRSWTIVGSRHE
jgi:hypothetical protein